MPSSTTCEPGSGCSISPAMTGEEDAGDAPTGGLDAFRGRQHVRDEHVDAEQGEQASRLASHDRAS